MFNNGILAWGTDIFALFRGVSNVLCLTLARLGIIKFAEVAALLLSVSLTDVDELGLIAAKAHFVDNVVKLVRVDNS